MKKYYFCEQINEEYSFTLDYLLDKMKDIGLEELSIREAVMDIGGEFFYCKAIGGIGEKSEGGCGKECNLYEPRNGKSGICKEWRHSRTSGKEYILTIDGNLTEVK